MPPFTLGVNYWPRRKAMYWWSDFDSGEVREEFAIIKEIGLNVVRMFLLWDDFQPEPDMVAKDKLDHLVTVADAAAENGLGLDLTFFTGHMSGPNWSPRWLLGAYALTTYREANSAVTTLPSASDVLAPIPSLQERGAIRESTAVPEYPGFALVEKHR